MTVSYIDISIVNINARQQWQQRLCVPAGATIHQALNQAQFFNHFPELSPQNLILGVFGIKKMLSDVLKAGDRIEIYQPLLCDPKKARRERV